MNTGRIAEGCNNFHRSKKPHCVGVSEAAHEVDFLEHCLHGGHTALLGTQAY